jgi:hypothetical protein
MGARAVDWARLESVCTERYRGFESRPIRHSSVSSSPQRTYVGKLGLNYSGAGNSSPSSLVTGPLFSTGIGTLLGPLTEGYLYASLALASLGLELAFLV